MGSKEQIFDHPSHTYTRALLSGGSGLYQKRESGEEESPSGGRPSDTVQSAEELPFREPEPAEKSGPCHGAGDHLSLHQRSGRAEGGPEHGNLPEAEHSGFHRDLLLMI